MKRLNTPRRIAKVLTLTTVLGLLAAAPISTALAAKAIHAANAIWADNNLYSTVLTDTAFKSPPLHSTDVIFNFADSGLTGQRAVAEAAPGDPAYNGGRWNVMVVTFTDLGKAVHDADNDGQVDFELTNAEAVVHHAELGHLTIAEVGVYFECPLVPAGGRQP
jgi:hypothetical protein